MKGAYVMKKICQSCGMEMKEEQYGTNADKSLNDEYCVYCYKDGEFTSNGALEDMIEECIPFMKEEGMDETQARILLEKEMPKLKRWRKA